MPLGAKDVCYIGKKWPNKKLFSARRACVHLHVTILYVSHLENAVSQAARFLSRNPQAAMPLKGEGGLNASLRAVRIFLAEYEGGEEIRVGHIALAGEQRGRREQGRKDPPRHHRQNAHPAPPAPSRARLCRAGRRRRRGRAPRRQRPRSRSAATTGGAA